jgi:lysozyme family protein
VSNNKYKFQDDARYCKIIKFVLTSEGDYSNNAADPGGATKYGVASNYNQAALKALGVTDVKDLTLEEAQEIYYSKYYIGSKAYLIPDDKIAYIHFDASVNLGIGESIVILNSLKPNPIFIQGNGQNDGQIMRLFLQYFLKRAFYYTHNTSKKGRASFLEGWINRMIQVGWNALSL